MAGDIPGGGGGVADGAPTRVVIAANRSSYRPVRYEDGRLVTVARSVDGGDRQVPLVTVVDGGGGAAPALAAQQQITGATVVCVAMDPSDRELGRAADAAGGWVYLNESGPRRLVMVDPGDARYRTYYDWCDRVWGTLHDSYSRRKGGPYAPFTIDDEHEQGWRAFQEVNRLIADAIARLDPELALVHDYQLALTPGEVRRLRPDAVVEYVLHVPVCDPEEWEIWPQEQRQAILRSWIAADVFNVHIPEYGWNLCRSLAAHLAGEGLEIEAGAVRGHRPWSRPCRITAHAIGIDVDRLERIVEGGDFNRRLEEITTRLEDAGIAKVATTSGRADPTKNHDGGIEAWERSIEGLGWVPFERLISERPEFGWRPLAVVMAENPWIASTVHGRVTGLFPELRGPSLRKVVEELPDIGIAALRQLMANQPGLAEDGRLPRLIAGEAGEDHLEAVPDLHGAGLRELLTGALGGVPDLSRAALKELAQQRPDLSGRIYWALVGPDDRLPLRRSMEALIDERPGRARAIYQDLIGRSPELAGLMPEELIEVRPDLTGLMYEYAVEEDRTLGGLPAQEIRVRLDGRPDVQYRAFIQPTRESIPMYPAYWSRLRAEAARIAARFRIPGEDKNVTPLRMERGSGLARAMAELWLARAGAFVSRRDGMVLMVPEYVLVQWLKLRQAMAAVRRPDGGEVTDPGEAATLLPREQLDRLAGVPLISSTIGAYQVLGAGGVAMDTADVALMAQRFQDALTTMTFERRLELLLRALPLVKDIDQWHEELLAEADLALRATRGKPLTVVGDGGRPVGFSPSDPGRASLTRGPLVAGGPDDDLRELGR